MWLLLLLTVHIGITYNGTADVKELDKIHSEFATGFSGINNKKGIKEGDA